MGKAILNQILNHFFSKKKKSKLKHCIEPDRVLNTPTNSQHSVSTKCNPSRQGCGDTRKVQNSDCLQWSPGFRPQSFKVCTPTSYGLSGPSITWNMMSIFIRLLSPDGHQRPSGRQSGADVLGDEA